MFYFNHSFIINRNNATGMVKRRVDPKLAVEYASLLLLKRK